MSLQTFECDEGGEDYSLIPGKFSHLLYALRRSYLISILLTNDSNISVNKREKCQSLLDIMSSNVKIQEIDLERVY